MAHPCSPNSSAWWIAEAGHTASRLPQMSFIQLPDQKRSGHLRLLIKRIQRYLEPLESDPSSKPGREVRRLFCEGDLSCEIS